jgi:GNAT superfamily N-acetyltransferase
MKPDSELKYKIEQATQADISDIVRLQVSAFEPDKQICGSGPSGYDCVHCVAKTLKAYPFYVIKNKGEVLAGMYYEILPHALHIIRFFVCPSQQGQGLGRKLIEFAETKAATRSQIELETPTFSNAAHGFYEHLGFKRREVIQYAQGQAYLYTRDLFGS